MEDECKQKLGAKSNMICSFNSSETGCSSTTKLTPLASETTKKSSMQENGHPKNYKAITAVIISVAVSGGLLLILFAAVVLERRRCSSRRFRRYVRPDAQRAIEEGGEATPLQKGINSLCVLYRKHRSILK